jgi:hypothetical protein
VLLAIRLSPERARFWETNIRSTFGSWTLSNTAPTNAERLLTLTAVSHGQSVATATNAGLGLSAAGVESLHLARARDWTVMDLTRGTNLLLSHTLASIQRGGAPFTKPATNYWIDAAFDLPSIKRLLSLSLALPSNCPPVRMSVNGEGEYVRTRGELDFPTPLAVDLTPWNIPTNLVHDPLIAFSAVRGIGSLLQSLPLWKELKLSSAPDQVYVWAQAGLPVLEYTAAQWRDADNVVAELSKTLPELANPWLKSRTMGYLTNRAGANVLVWQGAPFVQPELRSVVDSAGPFVLAGLVPVVRTNQPPPEDLLSTIKNDRHGMLYSWEVTGPRVAQLLYLTQLARLISHTAQMSGESASIEFLQAAVTNLGNCITIAAPATPNQVVFSRKSSCGLSAWELHLLADWLESPTFPTGFHTTVAPPPSSPLADHLSPH